METKKTFMMIKTKDGMIKTVNSDDGIVVGRTNRMAVIKACCDWVGDPAIELPTGTIEVINVDGSKTRMWITPDLPMEKSKVHNLEVKEVPVVEIDLINEALDPANEDTMKYEPDRPAGEGYYWEEIPSTICGSLWKKTKI